MSFVFLFCAFSTRNCIENSRFCIPPWRVFLADIHIKTVNEFIVSRRQVSDFHFDLGERHSQCQIELDDVSGSKRITPACDERRKAFLWKLIFSRYESRRNWFMFEQNKLSQIFILMSRSRKLKCNQRENINRIIFSSTKISKRKLKLDNVWWDWVSFEDLAVGWNALLSLWNLIKAVLRRFSTTHAGLPIGVS